MSGQWFSRLCYVMLMHADLPFSAMVTTDLMIGPKARSRAVASTPQASSLRKLGLISNYSSHEQGVGLELGALHLACMKTSLPHRRRQA